MPAAERMRRVRGMFELWCVARSRCCLGVFGCSLACSTAAREPSWPHAVDLEDDGASRLRLASGM